MSQVLIYSDVCTNNGQHCRDESLRRIPAAGVWPERGAEGGYAGRTEHVECPELSERLVNLRARTILSDTL